MFEFMSLFMTVVDEGHILLIVLTKVRHFCHHLLVISVKPLTFQPQDTKPGG
ncbi:hypothetical protein Hanom_Chr09g00837041 [Helianthus anomalus]